MHSRKRYQVSGNLIQINVKISCKPHRRGKISKQPRHQAIHPVKTWGRFRPVTSSIPSEWGQSIERTKEGVSVNVLKPLLGLYMYIGAIYVYRGLYMYIWAIWGRDWTNQEQNSKRMMSYDDILHVKRILHTHESTIFDKEALSTGRTQSAWSVSSLRASTEL